MRGFLAPMIKVIAIIALLLGGLVVFAATRPSTFEVQRSTSIKAAPDEVFAFINDFHGWTAWSPYEHRDPAMKRGYEGATSGKGAVYTWEGNSDVGKGRMEILEAKPAAKIVIKLDFLAPFEGHNTAQFSLQPEGNATKVTWAMHGPLAFVPRLMSAFISMDSMIGKDFETGLANLKTVAEK